MARFRFVLGLLLLAFSLASAAAVEESASSPLVARAEQPLQCQTVRAPDYYGLGVRLGIYFSWLQGYIANTMLSSEVAGALDTNTIFLLTLLVAMIKCSSVKMLEQIDGLILMHLSGGTIFGVLSIWGYRTVQYTEEGPQAIRHFGGFGTHARLIVSLGVSVFGLWFWMFGITGGLQPMGPNDGMEPPNAVECGTLYTFMFTKVRADGGIRIFYIIVCIACILYFGIMLLASLLAGYSRVNKMVQLARSKRWANSSRLRYATGFNYRELDYIFQVMQWANLIWLIFSALMVEFTLNFNHVTAVLGGPNDNELHLPSELLPLLIGAFGFVRICWLKFEEWRSPGDRDPSVVKSTDMPRRSRTLRFGVHMLQIFSSSLAKDAARVAQHEADELDELEKNRTRASRYLVSWLPWLSLLKHWRNELPEDKGKSLPSTQVKRVQLADPLPQTEHETKTSP